MIRNGPLTGIGTAQHREPVTAISNMRFYYAFIRLRRTRVGSGERTNAQTRSLSARDLSANP
jgi:hypothetical protein